MDSMNREKIQAVRKHKQQKHPRTLVFCPLAVLTCGLLCTTLFWFPSLYSSTKTFFHVSIPRVLSLFFHAKSLFILGNLIVVFLVQDSKGRLSNGSDNNRNNHLVKTTVPNKVTVSPKVRTYTLFSRKSSKIVPERRTCEDLCLKLKAKVECLEEMGRGEKLPRVGRKTMREEEKVGLLCQSDDHEERGENLENSIEEPMIPALSTDELKRRADDFIARINKQIGLEANQVLVL